MENNSIKKLIELEIAYKKSLMKLLEGIYSVEVNGKIIFQEEGIGEV